MGRTYFGALFEDDDSEILVELLEAYSSTETGGTGTDDADIDVLCYALYARWIKRHSLPCWHSDMKGAPCQSCPHFCRCTSHMSPSVNST